MAGKQKKQMMQRSRQKQLCRKQDWTTGVPALVIIAASMGTINADYDLSKSNPQGFAMWFLLIMGWNPPELFGLGQEFAIAGEGPVPGAALRRCSKRPFILC